ncbi:MAG TPA: M48 family metalloprotease [Chitinophagaceae bacterium]|jgi:predicted Zn-dependent protease
MTPVTSRQYPAVLYPVVLSIVLVFPFLFTHAQTTAFTPATEDVTLLNTLSLQYEKQHKDELELLPSKYKKDYQEEYAQVWKNVKEKFDKKEIYTAPAAQQYMDALVAEIVKANPVLRDHPFKCYFSRSGVPNASYIGEGIILFNMGLFYKLNNESEVAFVLCHEIGHYLLRHIDNSINRYVTAINSEEIQAQLRQIKNSEYGKREQVQKLVKGLSFDSRRHSRDHESQADSMAVELMRPTRFDPAGALSALALLDTIDSDSLNTAACLQQTFNAKNYPFQKKWLAKEEGLLGGHAHLQSDQQADSLKTHPDCALRIKLLTPQVNSGHSAASSKNVVDAAKFESLKKLFRYEIIEYAYSSEEYSQSLYFTLQLVKDNPADPWLVAQMGRILNGVYTAQKAHRLSKVVDLPSPDYPAHYNLLLQFIQNLYLDNIASISYNYLSQYHPQLDDYPPFKTAYTQSAQIVQP